MRLSRVLLYLTLVFTFHSEAQWTRLSETTGWAQCLCAHQGNMLVMGTRMGIFHSTDLGTTWRGAQYDTLAGYGSLSLASDGSSLYAARGTGGVTRSTDNGLTWRSANTGFSASPNVYAVHAAQGRVFAGFPFNGGVFASTNGGSSWFRSDSGMTTRGIYAFGNKGDTIFAGGDNGDLYRSTDLGSFWTNVAPLQYLNHQVSAIMIVDSTVYIGDVGPGFSPGLLRSTNWGTTWSQFSNGINEPSWGFIAGFARVDTVLFTGLYLGFAHGGVFRGSLNSSWVNVSSEQMIGQSGTPPYYMPAWSFAAVGTTVFAGMSAYGVYRSTDLGTTWEQVTSDVFGVSEERLAFFSRQDTMYAGGSGSGVFISTNNGVFWNEYIQDLPSSVSGISTFAATDSFLFVGQLTTGGVARSSNGGRRWQSSSSGLGSFSITKLALGLTGGGGHRLLAGTGNGVYVSTNNGTSWLATSLGTGSVTALEVSGTTVLAARQFQVWRSSDLGVTWTRDSLGLPTSWTARAFAKIGSRWFAAGGASVSVVTSMDDGVSWTNISGTVAFPAWTLATAGDTLYVSNNNLVYYTTNIGQTWTVVPNNGFSGAFSVRAMMAKGGYIYIGMGGTGSAQGAWRRRVPGATSVEREDELIPKELHLDQNYPNPFNPETNLSFRIPARPAGGSDFGRVSLTVYDILGRKVESLVDENLSPGNYRVTWDASDMPSGVYFSRLESSGVSITKRMLLIK